jgi:prophage tail gpP-like protein
MELRVGKYRLTKYNDVTVSLKYDCVADAFSFSVYFDPNDAVHRAICKPCGYQLCEIWDEGELVITGVLLSPEFKDGPKKELTSLSGYSITGVIEDSHIHPDSYPLQCDNLTIKEITEKLVKPFGLSVVVDDNVKDICNEKISYYTPDIKRKIADNLAELCCQRNIVLSHTRRGEVLLTSAKANKIRTTVTQLHNVQQVSLGRGNAGAPDTVVADNRTVTTERKSIYHFVTGGQKWYSMGLSVNGQNLHSDITVVGQNAADTNSPDSKVVNPYVPAKVVRPRVATQTTGNDNHAPLTARNILGAELKNIALTIEMHHTHIGGKLVRPNQIISVTNPNVYIFKKTRFFIEAVTIKGNNKTKTSTLTCVVPEVYNQEDVQNIFE